MQHRPHHVLEVEKCILRMMWPESEEYLLTAVYVEAEEARVVGQHLINGQRVPRRASRQRRVSIGRSDKRR